MATNDEELRKYAKKKVKSKQDLRSLSAVWVFVFVLTSAIWFFLTPNEHFWSVWPAFGIGIAILVTAYEAYGKSFDRPITDDDIDAETNRLKKNGDR